jgi:hypothetical protein
MTDTQDKSAVMVRVIVKLRPEQYDELFRHAREIGSTMRAFFRESAVKAMRDERPRPYLNASDAELPLNNDPSRI